MRKMKIYKDGQIYFEGTGLDIEPSGVDPVEEYGLEDLTDSEILELKKKPKNKRLRKKVRRIR